MHGKCVALRALSMVRPNIVTFEHKRTTHKNNHEKKQKNHVIDTATSMAHGSTYTQNHMLIIHSALSVVLGLGSMLLDGIVVIIRWQNHWQHNSHILIEAEKIMVILCVVFWGGSACHRPPTHISRKS